MNDDQIKEKDDFENEPLKVNLNYNQHKCKSALRVVVAPYYLFVKTMEAKL